MSNEKLDLNIERKPKRNIASDVVSVVLILLLSIVLILTQTFSFSSVIGNSMQNTIQDGDYVVCIQPGKLDYGDIVIADAGDYLIIKRIVGLPGDKLLFKVTDDNVVELCRYENGRFAPVDESNFIKNGVMTRIGFKDGRVKLFKGDYDNVPESYILTLGENEYFLMGDNRDNSTDSRWYGPFERSRIINKIEKIVNRENDEFLYDFIGFLCRLLSGKNVIDNGE